MVDAPLCLDSLHTLVVRSRRSNPPLRSATQSSSAPVVAQCCKLKCCCSMEVDCFGFAMPAVKVVLAPASCCNHASPGSVFHGSRGRTCGRGGLRCSACKSSCRAQQVRLTGLGVYSPACALTAAMPPSGQLHQEWPALAQNLRDGAWQLQAAALCELRWFDFCFQHRLCEAWRLVHMWAWQQPGGPGLPQQSGQKVRALTPQRCDCCWCL